MNPRVDDINPYHYYLKDPNLWELWAYSLLWVMQDFDHQP